MVWTLLPHLTACVAGESVMLLDLRQDRYFRLPVTLQQGARHWMSGDGDAPPAEFVALLRRNRVLQAHDPDLMRPAKQELDIPRILDRRVEPEKLPAGDRLRIGPSVIEAWASMRLRPLRRVVEARRRWREEQHHLSAAIAPERLAAYHRARRLVPIPKNCVTDSLALDRWLGANGPARHLVFGVTIEPFLAHCWLQSSEQLLNDNYDHVRRYAPILII